MRLFILALFVTLSFTSCSEDDITGTQKKCQEINQHLSSYKQKTLDYSGTVEQGGGVTGYFDGDKLMMAAVVTLGETEREVEEYFFDDNELMCVKKERFIYNKPTYMTEERALKDGDSTWYDDKKTIMKVSYCYFYDGRMVKWINEEKKDIPDTDRKYTYQTAVMLNGADKLKKMLINPAM